MNHPHISDWTKERARSASPEDVDRGRVRLHADRISLGEPELSMVVKMAVDQEKPLVRVVEAAVREMWARTYPSPEPAGYIDDCAACGRPIIEGEFYEHITYDCLRVHTACHCSAQRITDEDEVA